MRLILALIAGVTLVSVASTFFEVLAHKHMLRQDLERRTAQQAASLLPEIEQAFAGGTAARLSSEAARLRTREAALALGIYDLQGRLVASAGPAALFNELSHGLVDKATQRGVSSSAFGHDPDQQWLEEVIPLNGGGRVAGALALIEDAGYIRTESNEVWGRSFLRIAAFVVLIVGVTILMVRWFLMKPMTRVAERLRRLRMGHIDDSAPDSADELSLFSPLAREVETMAESLIEARAVAASEARLRDEGAHLWTAERLGVHMRQRAGSGRIFVVSNREPYMHVRKNGEVTCIVPPSGLVTAIEPVLRACDGLWVAHGSGSEDMQTVDGFDRLRVPPADPQYSLRRVWLSSEEEAGYYDGFSNEGLWPLCHIAHTRPIFRASDWESYQRVNEKFAAAVIEEMESSPNPSVFVQDYHLALVPQLIKAARPQARIAIFWHIPWPNPEAFGICPWQTELLDGLLGADLIGFHTPLHCNNFLSTVDRVLESRTDREHMTVRRRGHTTTVRPYPVSVVLEAAKPNPAVRRPSRDTLLAEFGVHAERLIIGVDRLDYTKGIEERLVAFEQLLDDHRWYLERLTMVQIAAPSRTRIASYLDLHQRVNDTVERINKRFQTAQWKPVILIERQCSHDEVERWYRAADLCLVTSLHDGMNLVAKEFVAARDDGDGVLVLSKFTGAAIELGDALLVNPYDIVGVAEAIHRGLDMDYDERRLRMQRMRNQVMEHNVYRWAASILGDLRDLRLESSGVADLGHGRPVIVPAPGATERKMA
jgi:trehalose 6-phosphate synthase